ncbi:MAG: immunoglobulin domain-containing protein, partial [Bacteroidota bacterium]
MKQLFVILLSFCFVGTTFGQKKTRCAVPGVNAGSDVTICAGSSTSLSVTTTGGTPPYTYQWSPTAGLNNFLISNPVATPTTTTTYTVLVTDNASCTGTDMVAITVSPQPTITITGTTAICRGDFTTLAASGGDTYLWSTSATTSSIVVNPTTNTTYTVTGTNTATGCANSKTATVTILTPSAPTTNSNTPVCSGQTLLLTASLISGATYSWNGPNSFTSTSQNPSIATVTTAASGTYSVTATISGCGGPAGTTVVTINQTPIAPTAASNTPVCSGQTL